MQINFRRIHPETPVPKYKTAGAVAFDLAVVEGGTIEPGQTKLFPTGLIIEIPKGQALILAPRSSNAKKQIRFANGLGIIDQDYHGPTDQLFLALHNFGSQTYAVKKGERLGQGMFVPVTMAEFVEVEKLATSDRGSFGTTG